MDTHVVEESLGPTPADYKSDVTPIWCPGCGDYSVLLAVTRALAAMGTPRHMISVVSGIGCSSRIPAYTSCYGFHGVHGRALAIASGLKLARPDQKVLVFGGDGDGFSIGGNHFLHACRRNVDITYVVMDNQVYGMTKGQASPTTQSDWCESKLTPEGPGVNPIQPVQLALACGANFVARGFSGQPNEVARLIVEAVNHPGFSVVHVLSPCVTFRPEQRDWKNAVHPYGRQPTDNPAEAMRAVLEDDGFGLGIFLAGNRPAFHPPSRQTATLADIEQEFAV
jgi:2-oxoglutarate/2-oxoacid ferredoxin oxidoreductase subunit beta